MSVIESSKNSLWRVVAITSHDVPLRNKESLAFSEAILNSLEGRTLLRKFNKAVPYRVKWKGRRAYLNVNNEQSVDKKLIWHEVRNLPGIDQQAAKFVKLAKKCDAAFTKAHESRCMEDRAPRSFCSKGAEMASVTSDVLSAASNSTSVAAQTMVAADVATTGIEMALPALGVVRGALFTVIGSICVKNGIEQVVRSYDVSDYEGIVLGASDAVIGGSLGGIGVGMLVTDGATLLPTVIPIVATVLPVTSHAASVSSALLSSLSPVFTVAAKIATALNPLAFIMYGALGFSGIYGIKASYSFGNHLKELSESENGLHTSLLWLKEQVRGADNEKGLKKMWNQFFRRTSAECCEMVREKLTPDFLAKVEAGDSTAIQEAEVLIKKVKIANGRQMVKNAILLTIAILGVLAVIGSIQFTGPLGAALFVIGALLWILVDSRRVHRIIAKTFYPDLDHSKKDVWKEEWTSFVQSTKKVSAYIQSCLWFSGSLQKIHSAIRT